MPKKPKDPRGGKRIAGPGKTLGRPKIASPRIQITAMVSAHTLQVISHLRYQARDFDGTLGSIGEALDRLAKDIDPD